MANDQGKQASVENVWLAWQPLIQNLFSGTGAMHKKGAEFKNVVVLIWLSIPWSEHTELQPLYEISFADHVDIDPANINPKRRIKKEIKPMHG